MKNIVIPMGLIALELASCKSVKAGRFGDGGSAADNGMEVTSDGGDNQGAEIQVREEWAPKIVKEPTLPNAANGRLSLAAGVVTNVLNANQELTPGQNLISPDKRFTLSFQADSNLVLYYKTRALWASNTVGAQGTRVVFQADGNLVMYKAGNVAVWSPNTYGKGGTVARLDNDGNFGVYTAANAVLWATNTGGYPPAVPTDNRPIAVGKWGPKVNWPLIPIHSVLLPTGKVFTFGTNAAGEQGAQFNYDVWNPGAGFEAASHATLPNQIGTDIFCGAPIVIPANGNVLIPGGDARPQGNPNVGIKDTLILNKDSQTLARGPYLANGRWYETSTTLPNGEAMVYGGIDGNRIAITVPEVYNPTNNTWRSLMGAGSGAIINGGENKWWYPRNWVIGDGRVFGMTGEKMYYINTAGNGTITDAGNIPAGSRSYYSSAVMYAPGKILQVGGTVNGDIGGRGSDGAIDVNVGGANPVITKVNPMAFERIWPSATVLPSGEVLVTGGSSFDNQLQNSGLTAEMWNPTTKTFRPLSSTTISRLYHSTSILLPDASVLIAGGGAPGPLVNTNAEVYYPPYLFDANGNPAARLTIGRATSREDYNHLSNISFGGAGTVAKVALIKTGAVTHSFDMEQRFIPLAFTVQGNTVNVRMPANANQATPGYYHLFLLNAAGVPSVSKLVSLGVPRLLNTLLPGDVLSAGDKLTAPDGRTVLTFQADGNLVLYFNGAAIWATGTNGKGAVKATMQDDGNLVLYTQTNTAVWSSNTYGAQFAGGRLVLQNDANLVIYKGTQAYWASGTCCR